MKRLYLALPTTDIAVPSQSDVVRPLIWDYHGSPRVTFFTGEFMLNGDPRATSRRPRRAKVSGQSVWTVNHDGRQVILTEPRPGRSGMMVFNTTDRLQACERIRVEPFEMPENNVVNGFEIRELPDGYVDCLSWSGAVMNTATSLHDALIWALSQEAPKLDDHAAKELKAAADACGVEFV